MSEAALTAELNTKPTTTTRWLVGKPGDVPERGRLVVDAGGKTIGVFRLKELSTRMRTSARIREACLRGSQYTQKGACGNTQFRVCGEHQPL